MHTPNTASRGRVADLHTSGAPTPSHLNVLSEGELALRWGVSAKTLQRWRSEGRGPVFLKLSKRITYPLEYILEYEREALRRSTSESVAR